MEKLITRWGRELLIKQNEPQVLSEYPRPLMVRGNYRSLNGKWNCSIEKEGLVRHKGDILVPFSPESPLSGVEQQLQPDEVLWYRRSFDVPADQKAPGGDVTCGGDVSPGGTEDKIGSGRRWLLHFGAVDAETEVFVNGESVGSHVGGYLPFTFDITKFLRPGTNELAVRVTDPSDTSYHARGKQKLDAGGMFYTAVSGIWQTVWLETVPEQYIAEICAVPEIDKDTIRITVRMAGDGEADPEKPVRITVYAPDIYREQYLKKAEETGTLQRTPLLTAAGRSGQEIRIHLPKPKLWTPDEPWLYTYTAECCDETDAGNEENAPAGHASSQDGAGGGQLDSVDSYFAMRGFSIEKKNGFPRVCLNHEEIFLEGVLDQGYWPDGIYTAPADEALIFDIEEMKKMGFNMLRKHMKVEPDRWYYHCDRLGMIVCQDMVFGGGKLHSSLNTWLPTALEQMPVRMTLPDGPASWWITARCDPAGRQEFEQEMQDTIHALTGHPSIAIWCIFNESWGQFDAKRMTDMTRGLDPTRLIDSTSGWFDQRCGDFQSIHHYFFRLNYRKKDPRALFLSEYGGYPWEIPGHLWGKGGYGYGKFKSLEELNRAYRKLILETRALRDKGFCGSVYTQVSDVEDEVNGIFTYDREIKKIERNR